MTDKPKGRIQAFAYVRLHGNGWAMTERGRPRQYEDHEAFNDLVDGYFTSCETDGKRPTLSGLSYHLGFEDRETFSSYASCGSDFARTVKRAKLKIADWLEQRLTDKNSFTPGIIFDLKNNHGWKDKTEQEVTITPHEDALAALR